MNQAGARLMNGWKLSYKRFMGGRHVVGLARGVQSQATHGNPYRAPPLVIALQRKRVALGNWKFVIGYWLVKHPAHAASLSRSPNFSFRISNVLYRLRRSNAIMPIPPSSATPDSGTTETERLS